jgi:hypothetical protein
MACGEKLAYGYAKQVIELVGIWGVLVETPPWSAFESFSTANLA